MASWNAFHPGLASRAARSFKARAPATKLRKQGNCLARKQAIGFSDISVFENYSEPNGSGKWRNGEIAVFR